MLRFEGRIAALRVRRHRLCRRLCIVHVIDCGCIAFHISALDLHGNGLCRLNFIPVLVQDGDVVCRKIRRILILLQNCLLDAVRRYFLDLKGHILVKGTGRCSDGDLRSVRSFGGENLLLTLGCSV